MAIDPYLIRMMKEAERMAGAEELERTGHRMEKSWEHRLHPGLCDICRKNSEAGWIPLHEAFPSGHQTPPAHDGCRCGSVIREAGIQPEKTAGLTLDGKRVLVRTKRNQ